MNTSTRPVIVVLGVGLLATGLTMSARQEASPLPPLVLPAGFQAEVFAEKVENARSMAIGPQGTIFVGSQYVGKVHAVVDANKDQKADRVVVIASGLDQPNGVAMRNGALYVATASRLLRFDDIEKHLDAPPAPVTLRDDLPNPKAGHTWKFIGFGPDDMLYMTVGAPCNVCLSPPMVSTIVRMKPDGSGMETFADGVRNSVGFDWHPVTRELWFTDNGRDMLGDDVPNDELNIAPRAGLHFGFPYCHQGDVTDPEFGAQRACSTTEPPVQKLGAHVAAIGFTFYTGKMFPATLADGAVYVNTFFAGRIFRVPVKADGSAGTLEPIETSLPLTRPDGLRTVGPQTLIQAEGQGRLTELTIKGNRAEVRVLREGLTAATGVTVVGNSAFVLVERAKAVAVPYRPQ